MATENADNSHVEFGADTMAIFYVLFFCIFKISRKSWGRDY